jgi:hypothetical protein
MNFKLEIGDGIFYSLISIIILVLFWLRFLEKYLSLWWTLLLWFFILTFITVAVINNYKKKISDH